MSYGPLTIDAYQREHQHGRTLRVLVDGVDVTTRCEFADDTRGFVRVLCGDEAHHTDWQLNGPAHVTPEAGDQSPHLLDVHGFVQITDG